MAEPAALTAWSAATEPVAIEPAALETEPSEDCCGCPVCICGSWRPYAEEGQSASPLSVRLSCLAPLSPLDAGAALGGRSADVVLVA